MILVIDNYDSFTYNLVQFIGELGATPEVHRNDAVTADEVAARRPNGVILSPGPCTPKEAGVSVAVARRLTGEVPILGVCLGHQSLAAAFGAEVIRTPPLHGKSSPVRHDGSELYQGLENPFTGGRYHSLVVSRESFSDELEVTAETEDGIVMGIRHREHPSFGVQFHPESILTPVGKVLLANFLKLCGEVTQ